MATPYISARCSPDFKARVLRHCRLAGNRKESELVRVATEEFLSRHRSSDAINKALLASRVRAVSKG